MDDGTSTSTQKKFCSHDNLGISCNCRFEPSSIGRYHEIVFNSIIKNNNSSSSNNNNTDGDCLYDSKDDDDGNPDSTNDMHAMNQITFMYKNGLGLHHPKAMEWYKMGATKLRNRDAQFYLKFIIWTTTTANTARR